MAGLKNTGQARVVKFTSGKSFNVALDDNEHFRTLLAENAPCVTVRHNKDGREFLALNTNDWPEVDDAPKSKSDEFYEVSQVGTVRMTPYQVHEVTVIDGEDQELDI